jgi:phospholipid transport system substrate-binding protein
MFHPRRRLIGLLTCLLLTYPLTAQAEEPALEENGAEQVIQHLNESLLTIMKRADELGYQGRYELVAPMVEDSFDLIFMAKKTVGRYWAKLSDDEKRRWVDTFSGFTISNFADRFDGYSGQTFAIVGKKPASHETVMVLTQLVRPEADDVELNYRMREQAGEWKVVDIYSGGKVSEVALRRSEYASVLKSGGIEKLIVVVGEKAENRAKK